jgi:hypothetical protein
MKLMRAMGKDQFKIDGEGKSEEEENAETLGAQRWR